VKKFQVFRTPPLLVVNLKRFKGMQSKQNTLVHFPIEGLDMSNFVISQRQREAEPLVYDLFGVSNHYGQLQGGHYTAYAKNDGQWYRFNDDEVEDIENETSIVSSAAYNLFYARRDIKFDNLDYSAIRNVLKSSN
jgi:ubiquitin C-terminal hydrolase